MATLTITKDQVIAQITSLTLEEDFKQELLEYVSSAPELTAEMVREIKAKIQGKIDDTFEELGVTIDEKNPEYVQAYQTMLKQMDAADKEYDSAIEKIETHTGNDAAAAVKEIDAIDLEAAKQNVSAS